MLDITSLAIDVEKSEEGEWFPFPGTEAKFKIKRFNNDKAEHLQAQLTLERWGELTGDDQKVADTADYEIRAKVLSTEVLAGWSGIGENGKELKFTAETAYKFLSDKKYSDLRKFVERTAMNGSNWRAKVEAEVTDSVKDTAAS